MITEAKGTPERNGFLLNEESSIMLDVADVLGRVGKEALRSVGNTIQFMEVFNCLATLRHVGNTDRYIAYEGEDSGFRVTSWNNVRLAAFLDLIVRGKVNGLTPNQREMESLRILAVTLRKHDHEQFN